MQNSTNAPNRVYVWIKRIVLYITGLICLALSVAISVQSDLGVSPVSSLPYVLSRAAGMELGTMTAIVFCVYVVFQIIILGKKFKWIQLLQAPCAILFGRFVSVAQAWLAFFKPTNYIEQLLMILLATLLIAVGIKLYLLADIVPQAADGLVQTISRRFGWELANVKNFFDLSSISLAAIISLISTGGIMGLREGTVIAALGVGRVIALLNRLDGDRLYRFIYGVSPKVADAAQTPKTSDMSKTSDTSDE